MTEQNAPPADAELVELAAKTFVAEYWEGNPTWERLPPEARTNLKLDMSAVIAAIGPAIRAQGAAEERAKVVALGRSQVRDYRQRSYGHPGNSTMLHYATSLSNFVSVIEQGNHDETE